MNLQVSELSKSFKRNVVFKSVNLQINKGECCCLIGKNGSGKSTFINMLIDVVKPDSGSITFSGKGIHEEGSMIKNQVGVLPEFNPVVDEFSIQDYMEYVGLIYHLDNELIQRRASYLIDYFFEEIPEKNKPIGQFSKGMKLKAGICAALIHKPKLLILDEPFDGLDMFSANNLVSFINDYRKRGNSIFISSHDMLFMEKIATHVSIIKDSGLLNFSISDFQANTKSFEESVTQLLGYNPKEIKEFV